MIFPTSELSITSMDLAHKRVRGQIWEKGISEKALGEDEQHLP